MVEQFGDKDVVPAHQIISDIGQHRHTEHDLLGYAVPKYFDVTDRSFRDHIQSTERMQILSEGQIYSLLTHHVVAKRGIKAAVQAGHLTDDESQTYRRVIDETYIRGLLPHIAVCIRAMRFKTHGGLGDHYGLRDYPGVMAVETNALRSHPITKAIEDLLIAWPGDRSELGALYFDQLDALRETHGEGLLVGCMSVVMLPVVAPAPERKREIVQALRAGLVDDAPQRYIGDTIHRPTQIARILGLCLISDHNYFATDANTRYNPHTAPMLIRALKDDLAPLERYSTVLTPAQQLFVELLRIAKGGEARESIPWVALYDRYTQEIVSIRARTALNELMRDLYSCQPATIFQDTFLSQTAPLATPQMWQCAPFYPPEPSRVDAWRASVRTLFECPDIVSEYRLQSAPGGYSVYTLALQLAEAKRRLQERGSIFDRRDKDALCLGARTLAELYREPRSRTQEIAAPTFFEALERSVYQLACDHTGRNDSTAVSRDQLGHLAHRYAEVMQRAALAEFALLERTIALRDSPAALRVAYRDVFTFCDALGFLERDPKLHEILSGDKADVEEQLRAYRERLGEELGELVQQLGVAE